MGDVVDIKKRNRARAGKGLSGAFLKQLAMVTMLIDHIGAGFLLFFMRYGDNYVKYHSSYEIIRGIGRVSFPIFIFLLTEGLDHTKNIKKYLLRLFVFCFASEIPFDLAFYHKVFEWDAQNVFFTLLIGLAAIALMQAKRDWLKRRAAGGSGIIKYPGITVLDYVLDIAIAAGAMVLAETLKTDYGYAGVLAIVVAYLLRSHKKLQMWGVCVVLFLFSSPLEIYSVFCIPFISYYNGRRGRMPKWIPYFFYPAHLMVIWWITTAVCG